MTYGINLIPEDVQRARGYRTLRTVLAMAGAAYISLLALVYFSQLKAINEKRIELASIKASLAEVPGGAAYSELSERLKRLKASEAELNSRLGAASSVSGGRVRWSTVLKKLSHDVPSGVWLRSVSTSDAEGGAKKLRLLGSATSSKAVSELVFALENSGYASNVELAYIQKRDFAGEAVFDFETQMAMKWAGEADHEW